MIENFQTKTGKITKVGEIYNVVMQTLWATEADRVVYTTCLRNRPFQMKGISTAYNRRIGKHYSWQVECR